MLPAKDFASFMPNTIRVPEQGLRSA